MNGSNADPDENAAQSRRRRLRAALDALAPDPVQVADRDDSSADTARDPAPNGPGLAEDDLLREVPPHHGA